MMIFLLVQHGRLKVRTSAEQAAAKQKEREKKMKVYNEVTERIFTKRKDNEHDQEALYLTEQLLSANPDFGTLWNFRREIFINFKDKSGFDSKLESLCKKELSFLQSCLQVNPKSYGVWHNRQWINEFMPHPNWKQELQLCNLFLSFDERNFHCWDYRRTVVRKANITPEDEFKFSTDKIVENFSNYSSWHYRSKLLPLLHPHESGNPERIEEGALLKAQIPLDITCMYVNTDQATVVMLFSQPVKTSSLNAVVSINNTQVQGIWRNAFYSRQPCHIWISFDTIVLLMYYIYVQYCVRYAYMMYMYRSIEQAQTVTDFFDVQATVEIIEVTMSLRENKVTKSISLDKGENEAWKLSSDCHLLRAELTAIHSSLLQNELDSCKLLLEEEPDNKWTIITIVLLMRALDSLKYQDETEQYLIKLSLVDPYRREYYDDLGKKFRLENAIERYWQQANNVAGRDRAIDLSTMGLTHLYHVQQLMLVKTVNLSANNLTNLDQCNVLQCVQKLIVSNNKLTCLSKRSPLHLKQLEELILNNNCILDNMKLIDKHLCFLNRDADITEVSVLDVLSNCPRLRKLDLRENEVCSLPDYRQQVHEILPSLRYLDNQPL
ncbi:hypothetical protein QZH41_017815 [Actinostola sp. cb2023]|nr:hypothetical protein QZH41_017815 [Actinostola sp. cb2023]